MEIGELSNINGFTKKDFFYFLYDDNFKYIYKPALLFYYQDQKPIDFLSGINELNYIFFPKIIKETESFIIIEWIKGEILGSLSKPDLEFLKDNYQFQNYEVWDNSLAFNLIRTINNEIKLIDYKHFNKSDTNSKPFIYMYNQKLKINAFYEFYPLTKKDKSKIFLNMEEDYPIHDCQYYTLLELE